MCNLLLRLIARGDRGQGIHSPEVAWKSRMRACVSRAAPAVSAAAGRSHSMRHLLSTRSKGISRIRDAPTSSFVIRLPVSRVNQIT